jgi:protein-tyrosine phosphatase
MNPPAGPLPPRFLDWPDCLNARDLGSLPARDHRQTRLHALVRAESSAFLTPQGQQALWDYGVRTVIDLRFPEETQHAPSPFANPARGVAYRNIAMDHDVDLEWPASGTPGQAMGRMYCAILDTNHSFAAASVRAILDAPPGGVLIHCHAGKDRTGLIVALVLGAVGVSTKEIVADYATSHPRLDARRRANIGPVVTRPPQSPSYQEVLGGTLPETMQITLSYLDQQYSGINSYLQVSGFGPADQARLAQRLLE